MQGYQMTNNQPCKCTSVDCPTILVPEGQFSLLEWHMRHGAVPKFGTFEIDFEAGAQYSPSTAAYQQTRYTGFLDPDP